MMEERVIILMKNEDPLCVEKERLTKNSVFIGDLIDDENQLEMNDFEPDMVALFLTLLEDGKLTELQSSQFRELHKMATVFRVTWLKQECRNWLFTWLERKEDSEGEADGEENVNTVEKPGKNKSDKEGNKDSYEDLIFVFDECLFVLRKWEGAEMDMMETFIAKRAGKDNSSFVAKYLKNFAKLDTIQLGWMLKLEVTNMAVFLEPLLIYIADKESLDHRIRFILKNIDLVNCCQHNQKTFDDLFRGLRSMKELTRDDTGFILELYMETMESRLAKATKGKKSVALTTTSLSEITAMAAESSSKSEDSSSKIVPESSSKTVPESSSKTVPESSSKTVPESSSKTVPESSSKTVPESSSKTVPESSSKTVPESSSKTVPESSSKTVPESSSKTAESETLEETCPEQTTVLFDGWEFSWFAVNCTRIWDISELINNGSITSMFQVIELLLQVYYKMTDFPGAKELTKFKRELRTACVDRMMQKASPKYINMITSALIHSPFQQKTTLTRLLNSFIKDEILCSQTKNLHLQESRCIEDPHSGGYKHVFYLPRDQKRSRDCCLPGTCGFIVKGGLSGTNQYWLDELCTEEEDYQGTGVHYHGDVIARDMFYYYIWSGARAIGTRIRVPDRVLASCKQWLPDVTNWVTERVCVQYKLSN